MGKLIKKILYIHGLSSSGSSTTVTELRRLLPDIDVIAPDLPIKPLHALGILESICRERNPSVIVGTSMGGMFAQQTRGIPTIIINPAFHVSEFMWLNLGTQLFLNERENGETEYQITKELCDEYLQIEKSQFAGINDWDIANTYGLFGVEDSLVNCRAEYLQHYTQAFSFNGGHRLTLENIEEVVVPLINKITLGQKY